jgi:dienelactone hydrolase
MLLVAAVAAFASPSLAQDARAEIAVHSVTFRSASQPLGALQQRLARERGEPTVGSPGDLIDGELTRPAGQGSFPAAVLLHGCSGLRGAAIRRDLAGSLVAWGYVVLVVDSFARRGIAHACTNEAAAAHGGLRPLDALGGLDFLAGLPEVDRDRIVVIGASQGGWAALRLAYARGLLRSDPGSARFKAAVAFYPPCRDFDGTMSIPTLILTGERDDWTPAADCERMVAERDATGAPIRLVVYTGAFHAFNVREAEDGRSLYGYRLVYDAEATRRSMEELRSFLEGLP